jgi:hypothetical protein
MVSREDMQINKSWVSALFPRNFSAGKLLIERDGAGPYQVVCIEVVSYVF